MHRKLLVLTVVLTLLLITVTVAGAITYGEPDGGAHPYVGLVQTFDNGSEYMVCSGALISPTIVVTAGHCAAGEDELAKVWFDDQITNPVPDSQGTLNLHPQFFGADFTQHDLAVVVLDEPFDPSVFAQLPGLGQLDPLFTQRGRQDQEFTVVGYGAQRLIFSPAKGPIHLEYELERRMATLRLVADGPFDTDTNSALFTGDASSGGACVGDSGGPILFDDTHLIAAIVSYSLNDNCAGVVGGYRLDQQDDLDWLGTFLD